MTSHSFRNGVPSEMVKTGVDQESVKAVGCWCSNAYKAYMKLPSSRRADMARRMAN